MAAYPGFIFSISGRYDGASFASFGRDVGQASNTATAAARRVQVGNRQISESADRWRALGLAAQTAQGPFSSLGTRFNAISRSLDEMGSKIGGTIAALAGGGALIAATASYQNYTALLKATTNSEVEFQNALAQTFEIANRSRTGLEGTIRLYARLKPTLDQAGVGAEQLGQIVETTNKAITLSGASTQEATAAMIQFAQALGSGRLSGEEFRSISEQAQVLRNALAEGIKRGGLIEGFDGSIGALRELANSQKLTTDVILDALRIMEDDISARFAKMPVTITQGAARMQTAMLQLVQTFESSTGGLSKVAGGMVFLADNMNIVAAVAAPLVARFLGVDKLLLGLVASARFAGTAMGFMGASAMAQGRAMLTLGVATEVARNNAFRLAIAQVNGTAAAIGWARAQNAAAVAGSLLASAGRGLLAILGGPLGAAITAVTIGLTLMATAKSAVASAADAMGVSEAQLRSQVSEVSDELLRQNGLLAENAKLKARQAAVKAQDVTDDARGRLLGAVIRGGTSATTFAENKELTELRKLALDRTVNPSVVASRFAALTRRPGTRISRDAAVNVSNAAGETIAIARQAFGTNKADADAPGAKPDKYGALTASAISSAKRLADAQTSASEKTRVRKQAELEILKVSKDLTLSEAERADRIYDLQAGMNAQIASIDARAKSEREAAVAGRAAAAQAKAGARDAETLANQQRRLADSARESAEGWAAQTEAQRIAERQGDALLRVQKALEGGGIDAKTADTYRASINRGAEEALNRPFSEAMDASKAELAVLDQILAGRESEAEFISRKAQLEQTGHKLSEQQLQTLRDTIALERERNRELDDRNRMVDIYASAAGRVQSAGRDFIRSGLDGQMKVGDLAAQIQNAFKDALADQISNSLFGDAEAEARRAMTDAIGENKRALDDNTAALRGQTTGGTVPATGGVAQAAQGVGSLLGGRAGGILGGLGTLFAKPLEKISLKSDRAAAEQTEALKKTASALPANPVEAFNRIGDKIGEALNIGGLGGKLGGALQGAGTGSLVAGVGNMLGLGLSSTGAQIGGAIGSMIRIPGGEIIGSIAGGLIGKLFMSAKKGSVSLSGSGGQIVQGAATGNSASRKDAATGLAGDFSTTLQDIADKLGGTIGSFAVSIGQRDDKISVDTTGRGMVSKKYGATQFDDVESAIAFALQDAISDGAIAGIRASTSRLLKAGKDLEAQLDKALKFEDVFKRLRGYTDPVGLAVEELNKEFEALRKIFDEAGASSQEYAELQKLYDLEREQTIIESQSRISQSLKALLDELTIGDNGLSLRDRQSNARAELDKFGSDAAIKADPEGFAEAARNMLDIERQLFGSQTEYFDRFNQIVETAKRVLGTESSLLPSSFSVGEKLNTTPITAGLGVLGDRITDSIATMEDTLSRILSTFAAGGNNGGLLSFPAVAAF